MAPALPWLKLHRQTSYAFDQLPLGAQGLFYALLKIVDEHGELGLGAQGVSGLARKFREPVRKVQRWIDMLVEIGSLTLEGQLMTAVNFEKYQGDDSTRGKRQADGRRTADRCPKHEPKPSKFGRVRRQSRVDKIYPLNPPQAGETVSEKLSLPPAPHWPAPAPETAHGQLCSELRMRGVSKHLLGLIEGLHEISDKPEGIALEASNPFIRDWLECNYGETLSLLACRPVALITHEDRP